MHQVFSLIDMEYFKDNKKMASYLREYVLLLKMLPIFATHLTSKLTILQAVSNKVTSEDFTNSLEMMMVYFSRQKMML